MRAAFLLSALAYFSSAIALPTNLTADGLKIRDVDATMGIKSCFKYVIDVAPDCMAAAAEGFLVSDYTAAATCVAALDKALPGHVSRIKPPRSCKPTQGLVMS